MSRLALWLKYLAVSSAIAAIAVVIHAQQTGPGGVPGARATNVAATNAANTFSADQTIASGSKLIVDGNTNWTIYSWVDTYNNHGLMFSDSADNYAPLVVQDQDIMIAGCYQWILNVTADPVHTIGGFCLDTSGNHVYQLGSSAHATDGWLKLQAIGDGSSGNTDLRGHVTLVSGSGTYTFSNTYAVAPTCVASDTTTAAAVKVSTSTTTLTLTGTGTDTLNYLCAD